MSKLDLIKIYKITFPNGKLYVGQTAGYFSVRKSQHIHQSIKPKQLVHKAIKKYGKEQLLWEIIDTAQTQVEADLKETQYIKELKSLRSENGYNSTLGGDGFRGKHTKQSKFKMSIKNKDIDNSWALNKYYIENPEQRSLIQKNRLEDLNNLELARISMKNAKIKGLALGKVVGKAKIPVILVKDLAILEFDSVTEAAKWLNVTPSAITLCLQGKNKTVKKHKVYTF